MPLIWMQNVHSMKVEWPCFSMKNGKEKPQFIKANKEAFRRRLILEDQTLVLLRRFSAKEQQRRLTAAPLTKGKIGSDLIGLENHVNYIYRTKGKLSKKLALGLSTFLNSSLLDRYFRISNGNTQVSATEIRAMPLPSLEVIEEVGDGVKALAHIPTLAEIDTLVWSTISNGNQMLSRCPAGRVYVTAFPNFQEFKRHIAQIAWETEVWLSEIPDHLIHFNGEKFMGPYE